MNTCIVCPTDFSETAKNATHWACYLAKKLKLPVHLYTCYHLPAIAHDFAFAIESNADVENTLTTLMHEEKERMNYIYPDVQIECVVEPGFAKDSIPVYAQNHDAKLIVMGLTGRNKAGQFIVGSTTVSVAKATKTSVIIVPENIHVSSLQNIVLASDFEHKHAIVDIDTLRLLMSTFNSNLDIVHVNAPNKTAPNPNNLEQVLKGMSYAVVNLEGTDVEETVANYVKTNQANLLVLLHKQHGFFERLFKNSHTHKMAFAANSALMILHE